MCSQMLRTICIQAAQDVYIANFLIKYLLKVLLKILVKLRFLFPNEQRLHK